MEELTLERLLTDMRGVLDEIQKLIDEKDIEGARGLFTQIEHLLASDAQIDLDVIDENVPPEEGQSYDHVLHQLLSNINGIIEVTHEEQVTEDVIEIKKKELLKARADLKKEDDEAKKAELKEKIEGLESEIAKLEADIEELKKVEAELEEVNKQIDDFWVNIGKPENEDTIDPKELEERRQKNNQTIEILEKAKKQLVEALKEEKTPGIRRKYETDLKKINDELEVVEKERESLDQLEEKQREVEKKQELHERLVSNAERIKGLELSRKFHKREIAILEERGNTNSRYYIDEKQNLANIEKELKKAGKEKKELEKIASQDDVKEAAIIGRKNVWENQLNALQKGLEYLQQELSDSEENLRKIEENIANLEEQDKDPSISEEKKKEIEGLIQKEQDKLNNENAVIAKTTADINLQKSEIRRVTRNINRAEKDLENFQSEKKEKTELEKLQERREKLEQRKAEIEGELITTTTKTVVTDRIDMGAEARRVGDNVFKTHEIRKELTERNITREEFIAFYEQGIEFAKENIRKIAEKRQDIEKEVAEIFTDKDKEDADDLFSQAEDAYALGDIEGAVSFYEKIRQNMIATGKYNDLLDGAEFLNQEITEENIDMFSELVWIFINGKDEKPGVQGRLNELQNLIYDQRENIEIFEREIQIIKDEQRSIEMAQMTSEELAEDSKAEKELRARQIRASMFGDDPELQAEWDERVRRFYGNRVTAEEEYTYIDKEGVEHKVKYETIQDYDEYKDDAYFLNLAEYKKNLEITSRYRASGNDPYSLTPEMIQIYEEAEAKEEGSGLRKIEKLIKDMEEYVVSFNGNVNEDALRYINHKTAGSTLKSMKPVKGIAPANIKIANAVENTFRFFGIRPPKFTRMDEHGQEVRDIKGGLLTLATDALVIGAAGLAIAAGPFGIATWGVAYAAKGVVTLGNIGTSKRDMKKYGDDIRSNLPTPYDTTKTGKEVARKEYYRTHDKNGKKLEDGVYNGKFSTWVKAVIGDRTIFRGRARRTEEAIVQERIDESDRTIDERDKVALETAKKNAETAERNHEGRIQGTRDDIRSGEGTNDIFANTESAKQHSEEVLSRAAQNQALQSRGKGRTNINPEGKENRRDKFRKSIEFRQTENLDGIITEGSIAPTAVTNSQRALAAQISQDRKNRVYTAAIGIIGKLGLDYVRNAFMVEKTIVDTEKQDIDVFEKQPTIEKENVVSTDYHAKLGECNTDGAGAVNTYDAVGTGTNPTSGMGVDSIAIRWTDKLGVEHEISYGEYGGYAQAGKHVKEVTTNGVEFSDLTLDDIIDMAANGNSSNTTELNNLINEFGLQGKTTSEIVDAIGNNPDITVHVQEGAKGWAELLGKTTTETVEKITGYVKVKTGTKTIDVPVEKVISVFSPGEVLKSAGKGLLAALGITATEALHEGAHQTQKIPRGKNEELTPSQFISKIVKEANEKKRRNER